MTQKLVSFKKRLTDHNHDKYITTREFNTLATDVFNARLAQANLVTKAAFDAKLSILNRKVTSNKSKHLLVENKLKELEAFDWIYIIGKDSFGEDGTQNYLVFQPMRRYFKTIAGVGNVVAFITGNLKDCLTKELILLKCLIIVLPQT